MKIFYKGVKISPLKTCFTNCIRGGDGGRNRVEEGEGNDAKRDMIKTLTLGWVLV